MRFVVTNCLLFCRYATRPPRMRKSGMTDLRDSPLLQVPADMEQVKQTIIIGEETVNLAPANGKITDLSIKISTPKKARPKKWRLFGNSSLAKLHKPKVPKQCKVCWDFHSWKRCSRPQRCRKCGQVGHKEEKCTSPKQCPNCLELVPANHENCPLQPKVAHGGVIQRPSRLQRKAIRTMGAGKYRQVNARHLAEQNIALTSSSPARSSPCPTPTPLTTLNLASSDDPG